MSTIAPATYKHTQDYIVLTPPGKVLTEKIHEMGIDALELARRCDFPLETIQQVLNAEVAVTEEMAKTLEKVTWIPARIWLRYEENYRSRLELVKQSPEKAVY